MCGIVGISTNNSNHIQESTLINMRDELYSRGPDDCGFYISEDHTTGLGHRRLSIIDLSESGKQPMSNEDGTLWLTFNGEIYNYKEIRNELINKGHQFQSHSDTEVIIHAYEEFGVGCLERFEGMFAFAIYDDKKKELFLCRDRFGIKPLYYCITNDNTFLFASELKSFLKHPKFTKEIDFGALGDFFKFRYIPAPKTIYKNTSKLPHAHYMLLNTVDNTYSINKYYSLTDKVINNVTSYTVDDIEGLLIDAVRKRLISDVEVGSFLSGGIDSSTITAIAAALHPNIKSFSIGFEDSEHSEIKYAKEVADHINTIHITNTILDTDDMSIDTIIRCYDEPFADNSSLPTYVLSRLTSEYVKVALSGDGGDEVFSGYTWYSDYNRNYHSGFGLIKSILNTLHYKKLKFEKNNITEDYYNSAISNGYNNNSLKELFTIHSYNKYLDENEMTFEKYTDNPFKKEKYFQYIDLNLFLVDDILTKVDRTSMANSLEVRIPFLDHKLVEAVFSIESTSKPNISNNKYLLKKIADSKIPSKIIHRDKKGFSSPIKAWESNLNIIGTISNARCVKDGILNKHYINKITHKSQNRYVGNKEWMIYMFEKWYSECAS